MHDRASITETFVTPLEAERRRLLRQAFQLSSANVIAQVARLLKNLALARLLGPQLFGLWNGFQVFLLYANNLHLGVLHAISREIPLSRGRGNLEHVPHLARAGLTVSLLASLLIGAALLGISIWLEPVTITSAALKPLAAVLVVQQLLLFYQFLLRAEDNFALLSKILISTAVLELVASVALVYWRGFNGIFYGLLMSCAAGALIGFVAERRVVSRLELDFRLIGSLIRIGFPIMLTTLGNGLLTTIDRMLIIKFLGGEALGYYSIGSLAITAISYLPIAINQVMYPKFGERYGATDDPGSLGGFVRVATLGTAHAMGLVLGVAFIALPLVTLLLPKYAPGIPAARILFAGFYFISLLGPSANLLLTINRQLQYLVWMGAAIALEVVLNGIALIFGLGIEGVALTTGITYTFCALGLMGFVVRWYLSYSCRQIGALFIKLLTPYILAAITMAGALQIQMGGLLLATAGQALLFISIYGPLSFFLLRRELPR